MPVNITDKDITAASEKYIVPDFFHPDEYQKIEEFYKVTDLLPQFNPEIGVFSTKHEDKFLVALGKRNFKNPEHRMENFRVCLKSFLEEVKPKGIALSHKLGGEYLVDYLDVVVKISEEYSEVEFNYY